MLTQNAQPIRQQYDNQRTAHNGELYKAGGSPPNDDVWNGFQTRPLKGAKGKYVFKQLKNKIPGNAFKEDVILNHKLKVEIAYTLRNKLEQLLVD